VNSDDDRDKGDLYERVGLSVECWIHCWEECKARREDLEQDSGDTEDIARPLAKGTWKEVSNPVPILDLTLL